MPELKKMHKTATNTTTQNFFIPIKLRLLSGSKSKPKA
jgi:hypothetical protein